MGIVYPAHCPAYQLALAILGSPTMKFDRDMPLPECPRSVRLVFTSHQTALHQACLTVGCQNHGTAVAGRARTRQYATSAKRPIPSFQAHGIAKWKIQVYLFGSLQKLWKRQERFKPVRQIKKDYAVEYAV